MMSSSYSEARSGNGSGSNNSGGSSVFFNLEESGIGSSSSNEEQQMMSMMNMLFQQTSPSNGGGSEENNNNGRKRFFNQMLDDIAPLPFVVDDDDGEEGGSGSGLLGARGILEESDSFLDLLPGSLLDGAGHTGASGFSAPLHQQHQQPSAFNTTPVVKIEENNSWMIPFGFGASSSSSSSSSGPFGGNFSFQQPPSSASLPAVPILLPPEDSKEMFAQSSTPLRKKSQSQSGGDKPKTATPATAAADQNPFKSFVVKKWTEEEDELLRKAVELNVSKNWKTIAKSVPGRNEQQCIQRWKNVLACNFKKGAWSPEEDQILWNLIEAHSGKEGEESWDKEAARVLNRTPKQCRERWENAMNPNLCNKEFTKEEDDAILSLHASIGNQWKKIAAFLNGRTGNRVKSRFQSLQKKPKIFHENNQFTDNVTAFKFGGETEENSRMLL